MKENDPIIDRSPEQKRLRVNKLRAELLDLGYSVVETDWLQSTFTKLQYPRQAEVV